ncbi:DNA replication and repair protein RecF [Siphonobacter sp. SORGH_AS_0500]|uniref:DNA replication/repair protein RecF n=1 Tax=Siphonobacter sp. SORGH_AS_0500 TaxID=1864824 RepID=UPI000CC884A0|nr:DNA replication and repair protein RecF [Siphonobacter sp. SORGH_AS_0500]PKK37936.1 DNA replication and repair protein RecF [Siphonobacter sp. SORGH_AS_0500]
MLFLERLHLTHYKSYESGAFLFSERVNAIVGENGSGKTNLLDAIYFLSLTKSAFTSQDALSIQHGADFVLIDGVFSRYEAHEPAINLAKITNDSEENHSPMAISEETIAEPSEESRIAAPLRSSQITISLPRGQRKVVMNDRKAYERLADHIGKFPVVLIAPDDTDLIREGSDERRKFFDGVLSQQRPDYLSDLLQYNRILDQRNILLKQFHERHYMDEDLLEAYSQPLVELALRLNAIRKSFLQEFLPVFQEHYAQLSESRETVEIRYDSEVDIEQFKHQFWLNRHRDVAAQRTTLGIHRDDFVFEIDSYPLKKFGSQGQQKSFVVALKLAQFHLLTQEKGHQPILLLDDIFDKLDDRRIAKLMDMMQDGTFGQVFLTDARPERTQSLLAESGITANIIRTT